MTQKIVFQGIAYASRDDMPDDVRARYERVLALLEKRETPALADTSPPPGRPGVRLGTPHANTRTPARDTPVPTRNTATENLAPDAPFALAFPEKLRGRAGTWARAWRVADRVLFFLLLAGLLALILIAVF